MEIEQEIKRFVTDNFMLGGNPRKLTDQDSFLENGFIDSTGVLELVGFIEETFEVSVADDELVPDNLDSISKIAAYVRRKKAIPKK